MTHSVQKNHFSVSGLERAADEERIRNGPKNHRSSQS